MRRLKGALPGNRDGPLLKTYSRLVEVVTPENIGFDMLGEFRRSVENSLNNGSFTEVRQTYAELRRMAKDDFDQTHKDEINQLLSKKFESGFPRI